MAYIGKSPVIGNFVKLDAITAVNGQAAYTMQNGGSNFTDYESVNQFLVSLNGTIQAPTDSFTVSGSTLTFASNLSTGDVIDFIMVFGNSLSAGTPTDATVSTAKIVDDAVTAAKLNADIISGQTALASEPADTDEFLVSDAGTLKRIDYSLIKGGGITQADQWRLTANTNNGTNGFVTTNWERNDSTGFNYIGSGISESSGVFSFPSTGIYLLILHSYFRIVGGDLCELSIHVTTNNSSYSGTGNTYWSHVTGTDGTQYSHTINTMMFDVTDTSQCKCAFRAVGSAGQWDSSHVEFIRLGDT